MDLEAQSVLTIVFPMLPYHLTTNECVELIFAPSRMILIVATSSFKVGPSMVNKHVFIKLVSLSKSFMPY